MIQNWHQIKDVKSRRYRYKVLGQNHSLEWSEEQVRRWQEQLGFCSERVALVTLKNTTQAVIMEDSDPTLSNMRQHIKKRWPNIFGKHINDSAYCDLMVMPAKYGIAEDKSQYCLIIVLKNRKYTFAYPFIKNLKHIRVCNINRCRNSF